MKDFLELVRDTQWLTVQRWIGGLFPLFSLFRWLFPADFEFLRRKFTEAWTSYVMGDYTAFYAIAMKLVAIAGVAALMVAIAIHLLGFRHQGNSRYLKTLHNRIGHLAVTMVNWYWLMLLYGLLIQVPVYWLGDGRFYILALLGLWVGPLVGILNTMTILSGEDSGI